MSDPNDCSYWEPAREIERLTVQICELRAENERLRAAEGHDLKTKAALRAEIERLQAWS